MLNETASDVVLLPWIPRRKKTIRTQQKNDAQPGVQTDRIVLKIKGENERLSARIAQLEAQLAHADSVLSRAVSEAFAGCHKTISTQRRSRLSA